MQELRLAIEEMSCQNCVRHVTTALNQIHGVQPRQVTIGGAELLYDPAQTSPQAIVSVLAESGYPAQPTVAPL